MMMMMIREDYLKRYDQDKQNSISLGNKIRFRIRNRMRTKLDSVPGRLQTDVRIIRIVHNVFRKHLLFFLSLDWSLT